MNGFADLKMRLEELPAIRKGRAHEGHYTQFYKKACAAKETLLKVSVALPLARSVLPTPEYTEAQKKIDLAAKSAKRLAEKLLADPDAIGEKTTEKNFIGLTESAELSLISCKKGWEGQLGAKTRVWEDIAVVVLKLGSADGAGAIKSQAQKLSDAVDSLKDAATRLPRTDLDASTVRSKLTALTDSVSGLDLNTPFGKFLQAAASPSGASLELLQQEEVSKAIDKHQLQKVFRVRIF
jgi:hypothetical protein